MFQKLDSFDHGIIPIYELFIGVDKFIKDDNFIQAGMGEEVTTFTNVKSRRAISDK